MENLRSFDHDLKRIFDKYAKSLCFYALNYLSVEADAEDIVQDVFLRCWEKDVLLSDEKVIKTYLFNSVRNACLDKIEKKDVMRYRIDILKQEIVDEETTTLDEKILLEIRNELSAMPEQTRKIITCVFMQNMKYREVADELDISINTVKTLLRNGVKHLRSRFSKHLELLVFYLKRDWI
jgi:RNA polymerase sigma-70 factor